jgi:hypothetical protein
MNTKDIVPYDYKNIFIKLNYFNSSFINLNSYHYKYTNNLCIIYKSPSLFIDGIYLKFNGIKKDNIILNHLVDLNNKNKVNKEFKISNLDDIDNLEEIAKLEEIKKITDLNKLNKLNVDINSFENNKFENNTVNNNNYNSNSTINNSNNKFVNNFYNKNKYNNNYDNTHNKDNFFFIKLDLNYHFDIIPKLVEMDLEIINKFELIKSNYTIKKNYKDISLLKCNSFIKKVENDSFIIGKVYFNCSIDKILDYFNSEFFNKESLNLSLVINKIQIVNNVGQIKLDFLDL